MIVGFAWLELVYVEKDHPATLAALSLVYFLAMLAGMAGVATFDKSPYRYQKHFTRNSHY